MYWTHRHTAYPQYRGYPGAAAYDAETGYLWVHATQSGWNVYYYVSPTGEARSLPIGDVGDHTGIHVGIAGDYVIFIQVDNSNAGATRVDSFLANRFSRQLTGLHIGCVSYEVGEPLSSTIRVVDTSPITVAVAWDGTDGRAAFGVLQPNNYLINRLAEGFRIRPLGVAGGYIHFDGSDFYVVAQNPSGEWKLLRWDGNEDWTVVGDAFPTEQRPPQYDTGVRARFHGAGALAGTTYCIWEGDIWRLVANTKDGSPPDLSPASAGVNFSSGDGPLTAFCYDGTVWTLEVGGGGGYQGDQPPTVELLKPEQGATVAGVVKIRGVASDDVGLSRVEIWLNGVLVDAENVQGTSVEFETQWNTDGWENGLVVITARAYDTLGQVGQDSVTVYVDNLLAAEGKVIYTKRQPQTGSSWRLGDASPVYGMSTVLLSPAPSDPRRRYNVRVGYHVPGDTYDLSQYTLVPTDRRYLLPRTAQTIRWAIWAEPQLTTAFWQAGQATRFVRLVSSGGKIYAVSEGPVAVWLLAGDVAVQADLSQRFGAGRAYDAVVHDGKVLIGTDVGLIAWDTDAGDEPVLVLLGSGETEVPAVAASGSNAYIATAGGLLRWDYPSPRRVATSAPVSAGSLGLAASAVVAADDTAVRYLSGSSWQQVYTLPGAARRVWTRQVGSTWEVWVGMVGGVVSSNPDWHQDGEFSGRTAVALAEYLGTIIAGTNSATYGPALLRRTMDGWSVFYTLPVAEVHDLLVAGRTLYAACGESPASIHAIVVAEDSQLVSGPEPPRFLMKILDYVRRSTND